MEITYHGEEGNHVAEIKAEGKIITEPQDVLDIMADCYFNGTNRLVMRKENIAEDFFDLKTGIAGEILQKFSTYGASLAIIGDFNDVKSKSLRDFIYESNKTGRINFVASLEEAIESLS